MEFNAFGHTGKENPDGSFDINTSSGAAIHVDKDGNVKVNIALITAVALKNVVDVVSHDINEIASSRSHVVRFNNGGVLQFAYSNSGKLIDFSTTNLEFTIAKDNSVHVGVPTSENPASARSGG